MPQSGLSPTAAPWPTPGTAAVLPSTPATAAPLQQQQQHQAPLAAQEAQVAAQVTSLTTWLRQRPASYSDLFVPFIHDVIGARQFHEYDIKRQAWEVIFGQQWTDLIGRYRDLQFDTTIVTPCDTGGYYPAEDQTAILATDGTLHAELEAMIQTWQQQHPPQQQQQQQQQQQPPQAPSAAEAAAVPYYHPRAPVPGASAAPPAPVSARAKRQLDSPTKAQPRPKAKGRKPAGGGSGRAAAARAAIDAASIEGPMVPYSWTRPAVKKDGVVTREKEVFDEACALRDDASDATLPQLKAMIVAIRGLHGATAVKGVAGKKVQVMEELGRERAHEMLRRTSSSRQEEEQRRRLLMVRNAAAAQAGTPAAGAAAASSTAGGAAPAPATPPPASAVAKPLTPGQQRQKTLETNHNRRRRSEVWAADLLLGPDGDSLRQPCQIPLLDGIPWAARPETVDKFVQVVKDLQWATSEAAKPQTEQERAVAEHREIGAWVILLRVFQPSLLRDRGGGGKKGGQKVRAALKVWNTGDYEKAWTSAMGARAPRAPAGKPTIDTILARAVKYGRMGMISKCCQALEAAPAAPATLETLAELQKLHPDLFVPLACPRRAELKRRVKEVAARSKVRLSFKKFEEAICSMPRSVTTWTTTGLLKSVGRVKSGLSALYWVCSRIVNAQIPEPVRPLLFDCRLMGLLKASNMQLDIEQMSKAAEKATHAPSTEEAAAAAEGLCVQCTDPDAPGVPSAPASEAIDGMPALGANDEPVEEHLRQLRLLGAVSPTPPQIVRPAALWAGEDPDKPALGPAPVPTAEHLAAAATATARPHPSMACDCPACAAAPARAPEESSSTRPIGIPDAWSKLTERCMGFQRKLEMADGLKPLQTGVGVPAGMEMITTANTAMLQLRELARMLNIDIRNMFNQLCRVSMLERVLDSPEELGKDFSEWAPYYDMAYFGDYVQWFWVEASPGVDGELAAGRWHAVKSQEGVRQGGPGSCFLAGVGLQPVLKAAQRAMDAANGVDRYAGDTPAARLESYMAAERQAAVGAFLDDASLNGEVGALVAGYPAYCAEAHKCNWDPVPKKTVMSGNWHHQQPVVGEAGAAMATEGEEEPESAEAGVSEEPAGGSSSTSDDNVRGISDLLRPVASPWVELLPGVCVLRSAAGTPTMDGKCGIINLGVPMGTDAYVEDKLSDQIRTHDARLRALCRMAEHTGAAVTHENAEIARQIVIQCLRYSANGRDVHFLRSCPRRLCEPMAVLHDAGIQRALACVLKQAELPAEGALCDRPVEEMTAEFRAAYPRMGLHLNASGLSIRPWRDHLDAAHVGMNTQAWRSSHVLLPGCGDVQQCAYPALADMIASAAGSLEGTNDASVIVRPQARDLAEAWSACCLKVTKAFPSAEDREADDHAGNWHHVTEGKLSRLGLMPARPQKAISRAVSVVHGRAVGRKIHEDRAPGYEERLAAYQRESAPECGDRFTAMPWMDDGELHIDGICLVATVVQAFNLRLPRTLVPPQTCTGCKQVGAADPVSVCTEAERDLVAANAWARARHAERSCSAWRGMQTATHDQVSKLFQALLADAGWDDIREEDKWWDTDAPGPDWGHRRPDITALHPTTGVKHVFDVMVRWATAATAGKEAGAGAAWAEAYKEGRYEAALKRLDDAEDALALREGRAPNYTRRDVFVPLAFEGGGAWGAQAKDLLLTCGLRMEGEKHEVLHWSGMGWGKHWRQRIGVAIARGRARLLVRAATGRALWGSGGRSGRQGEGAKRPSPLSTEWNQHSC